MTPSTSRESQRRFLIYVAVVLSLALVGALVGGWYLARRTSAELAALRAEIRAGGAPLGLEDLLAGREPGGAETLAWVEACSSAAERDWSAAAIDGPDLRDLLEDARTDPLAEPWRAELAALEAELTDEDAEALATIFNAAEDPGAELGDPRRWSDRTRQGFELARRLNPDSLALARRAAEQTPLVPADAFMGSDSSSLLTAKVPVAGMIQIVRRLALAPKFEAAAGDGDACVRGLEQTLDAVELFDDLPWAMGFLAEVHMQHLVLSGLRASLPHLDPTVDLTGLESWLEDLDPRAGALRALQGERAMIDGVFVRVAVGRVSSDATGDDSLGSPPFSWWHEADHLRFLRESAEELEDLERPWPEVEARWRDRGRERSRRMSAMFRGTSKGLAEGVARLESERLRALCALRARRLGVEQALAWLAERVDPLTLRPFTVLHDAAGARLPVDEIGGEPPRSWQLVGPVRGED